MRAVSISGPRQTRIEQVDTPEPGPGQVRIRVEGCGVCASNLGPWKGLPWLSYPLGPGEGGHEAWGRVDAIGPDVDGLRVGERVTGLSYRAYAELDLAHAEHLVPLPEVLGDAPFPGEAVACAMNIFRRSDIRPGDDVAIVGIGFLGALLTRLASAAGACVLGISRRKTSLDLAEEMGARHVIPMREHGEIIEQVRSETGGRLCDRVIEAVGAQWPLDLAAELTKEHGKLIVAGYHQDGPRQVNMQLWNWRGLDVINAHERDPRRYVEGLRAGVEATARGRIDPARLLTHRFPLEQLDRALDACDQRPDGFVKAVVLT